MPASVTSAGNVVPSLRRTENPPDQDTPARSASMICSATCRLTSGTVSPAMVCPTASAAVHPYNVSAASFQYLTTPSRSVAITACPRDLSSRSASTQLANPDLANPDSAISSPPMTTCPGGPRTTLSRSLSPAQARKSGSAGPNVPMLREWLQWALSPLSDLTAAALLVTARPRPRPRHTPTTGTVIRAAWHAHSNTIAP